MLSVAVSKAFLSSILLIVLTISAGCVGGGAEPAATIARPSATASLNDDNATDVGSIVGIVTNDEEVPLMGVIVFLRELEAQVTTDSNGSYAFEDVPIGKYSILVNSLGYVDLFKSVEVRADEKAEADFKLVPIAVIEVYHTTVVFKGKISCGAVLVPWCGITDEANQAYGTPNPTEEHWLWNFTLDNPTTPELVIFELVWQPTAPETAKELNLLALNGFSGTTAGPSVLRMEVDGGEFKEVEEDPAAAFSIGVYPGIEPVVDQRFDLYRTAFYGEEPAPGWSALTEAQ